MNAPEPWPFSSEQTWRDWREHLDHAPDRTWRHKREADCEIPRIVRCREGHWKGPHRPALVPERVGSTGRNV
jgi:hypothetical protein